MPRDRYDLRGAKNGSYFPLPVILFVCQKQALTIEKELLKGLYDCFYVTPELSEQEEEVASCHKALIETLAKPERKLVLQIIDA